MRRWRENRGNHPQVKTRGGYCRVVTQVHPDPLVKLVKTRRNPLLRKEVNLQIRCKDVGRYHQCNSGKERPGVLLRMLTSAKAVLYLSNFTGGRVLENEYER
jgi:hypothetical protein